MASNHDPGGSRDEVKSQFETREGVYKVIPQAEYTKPSRTSYQTTPPGPVAVEIVDYEDPSEKSIESYICYIIGRELFVCRYFGIRQAADLSHFIDKRTYKGSTPTCLDCNRLTSTADSMWLLVGFSAGQVQLLDPLRKDNNKLLNEERAIDKTRVTCVKWLPHSDTQFLVSHFSGHMYQYSVEQPCGTGTPVYQHFKSGSGYSIYTCKTKSTRNPLFRWVVGEGAIHQFAFSPCGRYLAVASQDGFLRVFMWDTMELVGTMRSYFGGLMCCSWSPDGKYIASGGEDDLVTVWSFDARQVVCRCNGHVSWVTSVAFDPYTSTMASSPRENGVAGGGGDGRDRAPPSPQHHPAASKRLSYLGGHAATCYRLASVGQDTYLCMWDLYDDTLRPISGLRQHSTLSSHPRPSSGWVANAQSPGGFSTLTNSSAPESSVFDSSSSPHAGGLSHKFATLALGEKTKDKKGSDGKFSLSSRSSDKNILLRAGHHIRPLVPDSSKLLGTSSCPRLADVPEVEAVVAKKISSERLCGVYFREDCVVTTSFDGYVSTWARPEKWGGARGQSPVNGGGTVV